MSKLNDKIISIKPIDTFEDLLKYVRNPPTWGQYCIELEEHSVKAIKNKDLITTEEHWIDPLFCHDKPDSTVTSLESRYNVNQLPKTLLCHDLANNYKDDSFINGTDNKDYYTFYNWAGIDIFCYFSHHFITIPPLGWINVGHKHGVKVIGTIIIESADTSKMLNEIIDSPDKSKLFADMLVEVAKLHKFEGWLLNIEHSIDKPGKLIALVKYFHKKLHREVNGGYLMWYDSITKNGVLQWQNALTRENKVFFDITDGMLTNYSWFEHNIEQSKELAQERAHDVFIGLDIWGRNIFGGGEFNSDEAAVLAHKHGLSLGIFAPAWSYEASNENDIVFPSEYMNDKPIDKNKCRDLREQALWTILWPYLNTKIPQKLPFTTSFCRGKGLKKWKCGMVENNSEWYNLNQMNYQLNTGVGTHGFRLVRTVPPTAKKDYLNLNDLVYLGHNKYVPHFLLKKIDSEKETHTDLSKTKSQFRVKRYQLMSIPTERLCFEQFYEDAFNGGSCLLINQRSNERSQHNYLIKLFYSEFEIKEKVIIGIVTKTLSGFENQYLNVYIDVHDSNYSDNLMFLLAGKRLHGTTARSTAIKHRVGFVLYPINIYDQEAYADVESYLKKTGDEFYVPQENVNGWCIRYYVLERPNSIITSIKCEVEGPDVAPILLGQLFICNYSNTEIIDKKNY